MDASYSRRRPLEGYRRGTNGIDDHWNSRSKADGGGRQATGGITHPGALVEGHPDRAHGCPQDDERTDQQAAPSRHRQNHSTRTFCCRAPEGCTGPYCSAIPPPFIHPCAQPLSQPSMSWRMDAGGARMVQETHPILHRPIHRPTHHQIHHATSLTRRFLHPTLHPATHLTFHPIFVGPGGAYSQASLEPCERSNRHHRTRHRPRRTKLHSASAPRCEVHSDQNRLLRPPNGAARSRRWPSTAPSGDRGQPPVPGRRCGGRR